MVLLFVHRWIIPRLGDRKRVFSLYWRFNLWGVSETRSGEGSTLRYTAPLRAALPPLLARLNVHCLLDAPCGDFHWMRHVQLPDASTYIGGDIVRPMIRKLKQDYENDRYRFIVLDVVHDPLPAADLWLCRDLVFHLPNQDIFRLLKNFLRSEIPWLLITSHARTKSANENIHPGGFRMVDLLQPPFSLPDPRERVVDYIEGWPERYLFLYHRKDLEAWNCDANL